MRIPKVVRYKINTQKLIALPYSNNKIKDIIAIETPFTIATKKKKYFRINLVINV